MSILDAKGDVWEPIIIGESCLGYLREVDKFFWPTDPRVPANTCVGIGKEIPGSCVIVNRTVRLPPTVSQQEEQRKLWNSKR